MPISLSQFKISHLNPIQFDIRLTVATQISENQWKRVQGCLIFFLSGALRAALFLVLREKLEQNQYKTVAEMKYEAFFLSGYKPNAKYSLHP